MNNGIVKYAPCTIWGLFILTKYSLLIQRSNPILYSIPVFYLAILATRSLGSLVGDNIYTWM